MNTDTTQIINAVFCAPLEDSCMEGQAVSEVDVVSEVNGEIEVDEVNAVSAVDGVNGVGGESEENSNYNDAESINKAKE